jgi:predicted AlkP superfamily pyrophosphatase or phosphodiesterase
MGAFWSLAPAPGHEAEVDRALIGRPHAHMTCWCKAEIPQRFHYGANPRVPPYFCLAETGWEITTRAYVAAHPKPNLGDHGFDPAAPEMQALFIANGPDIRPGSRPAVFDNVDVYPLLTRLLGVRPQPGDGDLAPVAGVLAR